MNIQCWTAPLGGDGLIIGGNTYNHGGHIPFQPTTIYGFTLYNEQTTFKADVNTAKEIYSMLNIYFHKGAK